MRETISRASLGPVFCAKSLRLTLLCVFLAAAANVHAQFLEPATEQKIRAATFEVVIPKPVDDPVVYEKPLPLDLLPYQFRTDKYFSIGTAFALGPHRYVTAAHVLLSCVGSQYGTPALRDNTGHVYPIKQILKFSSAEDFVVLSLSEEPASAPLEAGPRPAINDTVYAVGNALGDGVVIRNGLYTSDTPEEREGRWKWLRFSAAASPGNSGGPLLDKSGKVIGIVRAKSPNENLNYGVSIEQVLDAKENVALLDIKTRYQLDIFNEKQPGTLTQEFALPKSFAEFSEAYLKLIDDFEDQLLSDLLRNNAAGIFPRGENSTILLHAVQSMSFPELIMKGDDGNWDTFKPENINKSDLAHNGYLSYGTLRHSTLLHLRRPDDIPAKQFYADSKAYMDLLLKGIPISRKVSTESIRVLSLGAAQLDSVFVDPYGRKWQLREWPLAFEDATLVSMALPVPDGYVAIMRLNSTAQVHGDVADLKALSGFISVAYGGSFAQWQDFLSTPAMLPAVLSGIDIHFDYGHSASYKSARCAISYTDELQHITPNSHMILDFSFFNDHGKTVWDVAGIEADEDMQSDTGLLIARSVRPSDSMSDSDKSWWNKMEGGQHPYDEVTYNDNDKNYVRKAYPPEAASDAAKADFIYSAMYEVDGPAAQDVMKSKLDLLMQGFKLNEPQE